MFLVKRRNAMFDFEKISASKFYVAPTSERVVEFSPTDVDMSNIAKVLSLAVDARATSVDAQDGYAQVGGRVNFRLAYLDKDGTPKGVDYNADFTARVDGEFVEGDSAWCDIVISESDVEAGDTLTLTAVLEVNVSAIKRDEIEVLVNADDCYVQKQEIYVPSFIAQKSVVVPFDDEKNVGGEIESVLGLSSTVVTRQSLATDGGATAKLAVYSVVTYVEGGEIKQHTFEIPLEEEFNLDGVKEGDAIKLYTALKSSKIVLQGVTDDNTIRVEGEIQIKVQAYRCSKIEIVSDLFMLSNQTEIERKTAKYTCFDGCGYFVKGVGGSATLSDNKPAAIEVCALPYARCYTTRAYVNDENSLIVEGVANTDIIYRDENGYNSVRAELPFAISAASEIPFSKEVRVDCKIQRIDSVVRREREFDITFDVAIAVCGFSPLEASYISAVEVGAERAQNTSALSVYVASPSDTMLDVCSALSAMPEDILAQNPDLAEPFAQDTKIVYFRALK